MGLYDGLGAGIWRQACKSMETLRIVQFWRDFRCLLNFNEFYILQSADFLCEQQIWIVGDLSWPLQSPCSIAWNTMRFQVFRDTLAKHREVIVGGNSWGHCWWKDVSWSFLVWELEVDLCFVAIFELALYLHLLSLIYNWCQFLIVGATSLLDLVGWLCFQIDLCTGPSRDMFEKWAYC